MVILALGSNLSSKYGDRFFNIDLAVSYLESYGLKIRKKSSYYETESYPDKKNPKFINIVVLAETDLPPEDLASVLIFIEEKIDRKRSKKNAPRTCDIDIIDYKNKVINFEYNNLKFYVTTSVVTNAPIAWLQMHQWQLQTYIFCQNFVRLPPPPKSIQIII